VSQTSICPPLSCKGFLAYLSCACSVSAMTCRYLPVSPGLTQSHMLIRSWSVRYSGWNVVYFQKSDVSEELSLSSSGFEEEAKQGSTKIRRQAKLPEECGHVATCFSWLQAWTKFEPQTLPKTWAVSGLRRVASQKITLYIFAGDRTSGTTGFWVYLKEVLLTPPNRPTECVLTASEDFFFPPILFCQFTIYLTLEEVISKCDVFCVLKVITAQRQFSTI
jgi:hypothetical protein